MCGIFGVVNSSRRRTANKNIRDFVQDAFVAGSLRGMDSSGIFQIEKKKPHYTMYKRAVDGTRFTADEKVHPFIRDVDTSMLTVCHNRAATAGKVNDANAHPFSVNTPKGGLLLGVHNGTLNGWSTNNKGTREVDSHWAFDTIAEEGADAFESFFGAYSFVWYNSDTPEHLYFARNERRPMFIGYTKDKDRMLFASEHGMLTWLAQRNEIELHSDIIDLTPGRLYKFSVDDPREFTSSILPSARSNQASYYSDNYNRGRYDYEEDARTRAKNYVTGFRTLMLTDASAATTVTKEADKSGKQNTKKHGALCSPEEVRLAKAAEAHGMAVVFKAEMYDQQEQCIYGTATVNSDIEPEANGTKFAAILRRVTKIQYDTLKVAEFLSCRVVGAIGHYSRDPNKELTYILSRNVKELSAEEAEEIKANLTREIEDYIGPRQATVH